MATFSTLAFAFLAASTLIVLMKRPKPGAAVDTKGAARHNAREDRSSVGS